MSTRLPGGPKIFALTGPPQLASATCPRWMRFQPSLYTFLLSLYRSQSTSASRKNTLTPNDFSRAMAFLARVSFRKVCGDIDKGMQGGEGGLEEEKKRLNIFYSWQTSRQTSCLYTSSPNCKIFRNFVLPALLLLLRLPSLSLSLSSSFSICSR